MVEIGNYVADVTITLQDSEVAELIGIDNDDNQLAIAYDTIDWYAIEDALKELACKMVAKQADEVRAVVDEVVAADKEDLLG